MDLGIGGDVAIVTGGARGIGEAIVRGLAEEGAAVAIWDRDLEPAQAIANQIERAGGRALAVNGDVSIKADVDRVVATILDHFGSLQILVNNAGFSQDAPIADMTDDAWDAVQNVVLRGAFNTSRAVAPIMAAAGYGRIVNISSRSLSGDLYKANYAAAKAGLVGLTRTLAIELGRQGVTANAIAPGLIHTDRLKATPYYAELVERAKAAAWMERPGTPQDVADAVLYFASRRAGFVTGELLFVGGGRR